jgi:group I intron endonuclease
MAYGIIYKSTSPMGKIYIGQTVKTLKQRKIGHKFRSLKGDMRTAFQSALLEEGFENFTWEQIDTADTAEELDAKEKRWIAHYNSTDPVYGYNSTDGGVKFRATEETRKKISMAHTGKTLTAEHRRKIGEAIKGRHHTAEARKKMSEASRGKNNPNFGKHLSEEHRKRISESLNGENHPRAKLTEADVRQIKIALTAGEHSQSIASKFGVSSSAIRKIKQKSVWAWLDVSAG